MPLKIYEYNRCGTCRKAIKFLQDKKIKHEIIPIRETPPTLAELQTMLKSVGDIKKLLNTSGQDYRNLNMKEKIASLSTNEILELLRTNGNLIKRPFVLGDGIATTGFNPDVWTKIF